MEMNISYGSAKWVYKEPLGVQLKEQIVNGQLKDILKTIYAISGNLMNADWNFKNSEEQHNRMKSTMHEFHYLIEGEWDYTRQDLEDYGDWGSMRELADARLEDFYDLCDQYRVWLNIMNEEG